MFNKGDNQGNKIRALRMSDKEYEKVMGFVKANGCKNLGQLLKKINKGELVIVKNPLTNV